MGDWLGHDVSGRKVSMVTLADSWLGFEGVTTGAADAPVRVAGQGALCRRAGMNVSRRGVQALSWIRARRLTAALPNARLTVVADGAHGLIFDAPEAFNRAVCEFLREQGAGSGSATRAEPDPADG